jgi:hypothetical protein
MLAGSLVSSRKENSTYVEAWIHFTLSRLHCTSLGSSHILGWRRRFRLLCRWRNQHTDRDHGPYRSILHTSSLHVLHTTQFFSAHVSCPWSNPFSSSVYDKVYCSLFSVAKSHVSSMTCTSIPCTNLLHDIDTTPINV